MAKHNELGILGEKIAVAYLIANGYEIVTRNFRYDRAEIDIIAKTAEGVIVFVEVKTRGTDIFGDPESFVTPKKIKQIIKAANGYVEIHDLDAEMRFDVIGVVKNRKQEHIRHLPDAFYFF